MNTPDVVGCPHCGASVRNQAQTCPKCKLPIPREETPDDGMSIKFTWPKPDGKK